MPQFVMPGKDHPTFKKLPPFTQAYIEAAFFTNTNTSIRHFRDLPTRILAAMIFDCARFMRRAIPYLHPQNLEQAGHHFWLTRNNYGARFWDGDWEEPDATDLDNLARSFGEFEL